MTSEKASHEPLLIPLPAEMAVKKGGFEFTPKTVIIYTSSSSETIARTLATPLRPATGFLLPVQSKKSQHSNVIVFETSQDDTLDNEEYTLITTSSQVTITAKTAAGFFTGRKHCVNLCRRKFSVHRRFMRIGKSRACRSVIFQGLAGAGCIWM
ncbi:MAG: glycoside hydrolase family 20 zincin-like fold domain-containing protein [Kiritimatiellales bacterium]